MSINQVGTWNTWKLEIQPAMFCFKNIFNYRDDTLKGRKSPNCSQAHKTFSRVKRGALAIIIILRRAAEENKFGRDGW